MAGKANARVVRTIKAAPVELIEADRAAMLALPPIPLRLGWANTIRLGRDYYVRLDTNDYSVDPSVIGRMVDVSADLERVRVRTEGRIVAEHTRIWARGTTITDPVQARPRWGALDATIGKQALTVPLIHPIYIRLTGKSVRGWCRDLLDFAASRLDKRLVPRFDLLRHCGLLAVLCFPQEYPTRSRRPNEALPVAPFHPPLPTITG